MPAGRTPEDLTAAIETTHRAFFSRFGRRPNGEQGSRRGVTWYRSGVDYALFNGAFSNGPTPEPEIIEEVVAEFRPRQLPFLWWILPSSRDPSELRKRLHAAGFVPDHEAPGMALELTKLVDPPPAPQGFRFETVRGEDGLEKFGRTLNAGDFQAPEEVAREIPRLLQPEAGDPSWRFFIGLLHERPVATSLRVNHGGVVGIYGISTIPEARRQGIGTIMTRVAVDDGRSSGDGDYAVLTATPLGAPVYRKMGFQECCRVGAYIWNPRPSSD